MTGYSSELIRSYQSWSAYKMGCHKYLLLLLSHNYCQNAIPPGPPLAQGLVLSNSLSKNLGWLQWYRKYKTDKNAMEF